MGIDKNRKVTVQIFEREDGSDDPRAIQGGGGASERFVEGRTNSLWLIERYIAIIRDRGDDWCFSIVCIH